MFIQEQNLKLDQQDTKLELQKVTYKDRVIQRRGKENRVTADILIQHKSGTGGKVRSFVESYNYHSVQGKRNKKECSNHILECKLKM